MTWQPDISFDTGVRPILELLVTDNRPCKHSSTLQLSIRYSIHTQSLSWCSTGLLLLDWYYVLPRRNEGSAKPCAVNRAL